MKCNSTKVLKYFLCFLFALFLLIIIYAKKCFSVSAYAIDDEILIPCNATTEDEFYDDIIIITLKHNASLQFYDYSKEDFEDINCESVEELTIYTSEIVREQIAANNSGDWSKLKERIDKNMLVNIETFHRILCLTINNPGKDNVLSAIKKLEERNDIISAEPDYFTWLESTASDSYYISGDQWGLNGPFGIKANTAWDTITGNHNTLVGILDTGIDASHPDLVNNISDNLHRDFVDHPLLIPYRDVSKADLTDNDGHGTHVAGIVGAQGNNGVGISGVAWNVKLVSLRVFGSNPGRNVYIKRAIDYATSKNIQVLNYSGGGNDYDNSLKMSIQNYPGLLICAAGNNGQNNDLYEHYPSNYDLPNIISVGASNSAGKWTPHSNFGATTVDIFAPGIDIISTYPTNLCSDLNHIFSDGTHLCELKANCAIYLKGLVDSGNYTWYDIESNFSTLVSSYYTDPIITISDAKDSDHMSYYYHEMIGTSMAAPHVTGVVSLLLSLNSNVTPLELKEAILHSAYHHLIEGVNPLENYCVTDGILSACEAVNYYITNSLIENSSYLLECYSKNNSSTQVCNAGNSIYYKFIINCNTSYKFVSNASCPINMTFYDEDLEVMSSITPTMSNNNCTGTIITTLTPGTYYLRVNYVSDSDTGNITTSFRPTTYSDGVELYLDTNNNINTHIHKTIDNNYHTEGYYENISGAGFYKITLTEGSNVYYPAGTIKIYEDSARQYLIDKYDVTGMNIPAVSNEGENILYVFFPDICTYYFDITLPYSSYSSLTLRIERSDINNFDYTNTLIYSSFNVLFENIDTRSYFEEVTISHRSKFRFEISSNDALYNLIPFYVFKKEGTTGYNPYYRYHNVEVSTSSFGLNTNQTSKVYIIILEAGTYYVGYSGNVLNNRLNCAIGRIVDYDASSLDPLVTDYATTEGFVLGSEVTFNGGLLQGTTITEGFTRCLYLMFEPGVEIPNSRLDYDWYSTNEAVATVTQYGTVLGLPVSNNTSVTIYAILREDPSVVYSINLTILNDTSVVPIEILSNMSYSYSAQNGTYQLALNSSNCPYPWINYYIWDIEIPIEYPNLEVDINTWGYITSNGIGEATISGSYILNSRVTLTIHLNINA